MSIVLYTTLFFLSTTIHIEQALGNLRYISLELYSLHSYDTYKPVFFNIKIIWFGPRGSTHSFKSSTNWVPSLCYILGLVLEATMISKIQMVPILREPPQETDFDQTTI